MTNIRKIKKFEASGFKIQDREGFSLIEVILFAAIGGAILFVVANMTRNVSQIEDFVNQKLKSRGDLEQTFQILVTDIRSAGASSGGAYPIESASTSSLVFYSDVDQDGIMEKVRYALATSTIRRGLVEPTGNPLVYASSSEVLTNIIENVIVSTSTNLFDYFDSTYYGSSSAMISPINISIIRVVKISVFVDTNPGKSPKPTLFSDTITIRNLRSN